MELEYVFYTTDDSFDYGDCGRTCQVFTKHGFTIEVNSVDGLDIKSLKGFNDYLEIQDYCQNLNDLKCIIEHQFENIQEENDKEKFKELLEMIDYEEMR